MEMSEASADTFLSYQMIYTLLHTAKIQLKYLHTTKTHTTKILTMWDIYINSNIYPHSQKRSMKFKDIFLRKISQHSQHSRRKIFMVGKGGEGGLSKNVSRHGWLTTKN